VDASVVAFAVSASLCGAHAAPYLKMLAVDDSEFTPDHRDFLNEWANNLEISL
jgi:hypothetical protein